MTDPRKIDALVATHLMGWRLTDDRELAGTWETNKIWYPPEDGGCPCRLPYYSSDIAAAWEVLLELKHLHPAVSYCDTTCSWSVEWLTNNSDALFQGDSGWDAPLVICLAALKAKGVDVES